MTDKIKEIVENLEEQITNIEMHPDVRKGLFEKAILKALQAQEERYTDFLKELSLKLGQQGIKLPTELSDVDGWVEAIKAQRKEIIEEIEGAVNEVMRDEFEWDTPDYVRYSGRPHIIRQALLSHLKNKV